MAGIPADDAEAVLNKLAESGVFDELRRQLDKQITDNVSSASTRQVYSACSQEFCYMNRATMVFLVTCEELELLPRNHLVCLQGGRDSNKFLLEERSFSRYYGIMPM